MTNLFSGQTPYSQRALYALLLQLLYLIRACRPNQYSKNLLVFAAPLFAFQFGELEIWVRACGAMLAFCLISSSIYLLNDSLDLKSDRQHPTKCFRPIAAGLVSVPKALTTSALLVLSSLTLAAGVSQSLAAVLLVYALIQVGYSLHLKNEPLLDLFCIASGFLLRAIAGGVAANLTLSPWFLLTVGLLAMFLAVEKRKAELQVLKRQVEISRKVLKRYSLPLLLRLESLVSTSAFMSYALWAAGPALQGASTRWMLLTVPFVLVGICRYQLLSDPEEAERRLEVNCKFTTEKPEDILFHDRGIKFTVLGWLLTTSVIGVIKSAS
jgi:decaprenyl-phosphate phosphoribosyltransferase